jgi:putative MFS transporter
VAIEERSEQYLRILLFLLIPAAFFNGFDGELRALLAPQLQRAFHVSLGTLGLANVPIAAGSFVAFFAIRLADRVGRRPLLLIGLFGYALFTGLTAASWSVWSFVLFQSFTQVFAGTEFALAAIVVLEEFPIATRGRALGKLLLAVPLGTAATAVLLGAGLQHTPLAWRSFYLVGVLPALAIGFARRYVRETVAFTESRGNRPRKEPMSAALVKPWRERVLALGVVNFLVKIPVTAGAGWWVYYAEHEHHFSTGLVAVDLGTAVVLGTVGYYVCGLLIDRFPRKPVATIYFLAACVSGVALFHSSSEAANFVFLVIAVFFGLGVGPALSAMSAESFPTRIRAQGSAIVGSGFSNAGQVTGGSIVGVLGERGGLIGNIGDTVSILSVLLLAALPVLWRFVPETQGTKLDAVPDETG